MPKQTIVAVTSLAREALVARGSGVSVVCSQGTRLGAALHAAIHPGVSGIISFGISGGLNPELVAGDWVVASAVRYRDRMIATDSKWRQELFRRLPGAVLADIAGSDTMVPTPAEKSHLHRTTGAVAVDMESHIAAEIAAAHQIPFAACRVIIDAAHRALPSAAGLALDSNGAVNVFAVTRSVLQTPGQLPDLVRAAFDACIAERALRKGRKQLGLGFGSPFVDGRAVEREFAGPSDVSNDFLRPPICETP
ncbi:MAG TPA: adenosylhopane nucleosidase [Pseudolabrys sp.]|nr:adenosylhopane nucleosidase [Pseudolabrys sp.]